MSKILAIIILTFKEVIRKKIFLIIGLFTILLIASSALFPAIGEGGKVKLVEIWLVRGISFFGMIMAIFLAGASIPAEIEAKLVYFVVSKPVSKETYLIGKFLGFCLVIACFIAVIGIIGIIYLHTVDFITAKNQTGISYPKESIKADSFYFVQPPNQPGAGMMGVKETNQPVTVTLKGDGDNEATWYFENLDKDTLKDPVEIKLTAQIRESQYQISSDMALVIRNITEEKETTQRFTLFYERPIVLQFDRSYIDALGKVNITAKRINPASELTVTPESLAILSAPSSFEWNFFKTSLLIYLRIILIMGILIGVSTFLSGGVTIFLGIFLYFTGSAMGFFRESLTAMEKMMKIIAEQNLQAAAGRHVPYEDVMPLWLMKLSKSVSYFVFEILPDLGKYDGTNLLLTAQPVTKDLIGGSFSYMLIYVSVVFIIGWIGFRSRDLQ
ncbi:MAG: ABC transporter permease [Planctomycetes bacterium]|nr:ABC transporter permease [Planctomycetota bacterium]